MEPNHPPACCEDGLPEPGPATDEHLAEVAKALGHPARIEILRLFDVCRPHTAGDIAAHLDLAQSTVSEHLRILREAGVVFATKDGPWTWYCLRRSILRRFADGVADLTAEPLVAAFR
jgi:ArsR family transcriptional regulator